MIAYIESLMLRCNLFYAISLCAQTELCTLSSSQHAYLFKLNRLFVSSHDIKIGKWMIFLLYDFIQNIENF